MEYLPEPIIHRIQSFLTGKEAARTTLVSKSWRSAWLTRPDLDFDEEDHSDDFYKFQNVVSECIKRYVLSNLNIQSFSLSMNQYYSDDCAAKQFIVKALEIGATRLILRMEANWSKYFVLPNDLFASENLVELSVEGCRIDHFPSSVRWSRLVSLTLTLVSVKNIVLAHILSHCPLIEKLSLSDKYEGNYSCYDEVYKGTVGIELPKMHNLRSLRLSGLRFQSLFMGELSSKLPALKYLAIKYMNGFGLGSCIRISNHSLEQLNINVKYRSMELQFDVPSIRRFTYKGSFEMSSLSFKSTAKEWESRVSIKCYDIGISWFCGLNKLLTGLGRSTIYLYLDVYNSCCFNYDLEDIQGLPKPRVENLVMTMTGVRSLSCYALFDGLFRICSPKFITQYMVPESSDGWKTNNHFLCKALVQKMCGKRTTLSFYLYGLDDLREANLRIWDEVDGEWHDVVPLESLLDAPTPTTKQKIQFRLGWK